jgi:hypothetical protein
MSNDDARNRLNLVHRVEHRSARLGAIGTAACIAVLVIAAAVVVDLEMLWLLGLVVIGFVGLFAARPLRLRLDWSDRFGVGLLVAAGLLTVATYLVVQFIIRSMDSSIPNTLSALAAAVVIFGACLPALIRLATRGPASRQGTSGNV